MVFTGAVSDSATHEIRCPGCGQIVDPLRAAHVALLDGKFQYFSSTACKTKYLNDRGTEGDAETEIPPEAEEPTAAAPPTAPATATSSATKSATSTSILNATSNAPATSRANAPSQVPFDRIAAGSAVVAIIAFGLVLVPGAHRFRWPLTLLASGILFAAFAQIRARLDVAIAALPLAVLAAAARTDHPVAIATGSLVAAAAAETAALAGALLLAGLWKNVGQPARAPWRSLERALTLTRVASGGAALLAFIFSYATSRALSDAVVVAAASAICASTLTMRARVAQFERATSEGPPVDPRAHALDPIDTLVVEEGALAPELVLAKVETWGEEHDAVVAMAREHLHDPRFRLALGSSVRPFEDVRAICVGPRETLTAARISAARGEGWATAAEQGGAVVRFVAVDGRLVGCLAFDRRARPGLSAALNSVRNEGIELVFFSEESSLSAQAFARTFSIDLIRAERSASERDETARTLAEEGRRIAWLGHDTSALTAAQPLSFTSAEEIAPILRGVARSRRAEVLSRQIVGISSVAGAFSALALGVGLVPAYAAAVITLAASVVVTQFFPASV